MSWIDADVNSWGAGIKLDATLRAEFAKHTKQSCRDDFCEAVSRGLYMIHKNRAKAANEDDARIRMENRAKNIKDAAKALNNALLKLDSARVKSDPSQTHILEGSINGTGLVSFSQECTARLIERCDIVLGFHGKDRGGQRRSTDIAGVLMIARAWRDCTGKEPSAKGTFGAFLNSVFATLGWDQVSPNTLQHWMDSQ